jgi:hypothetical protein
MTGEEEAALRSRFPDDIGPRGVPLRISGGPPPANNSGIGYGGLQNIPFDRTLFGRWLADPDPVWRMIALANIPFTGMRGQPPQRAAVEAVQAATKDRDKRVRERAEWALSQWRKPLTLSGP